MTNNIQLGASINENSSFFSSWTLTTPMDATRRRQTSQWKEAQQLGIANKH